MSHALVICRDPNIGDSLMSIPAIHAIAQQYDRVFVAMSNREIGRIMAWPANAVNVLDAEPEFAHTATDVFALGVAAAIAYEFRWDPMLHPTQHLFGWAGLEIPAEVPQPRLNVADMDAPEYDILIAPWSRDPGRSLMENEALALADDLRRAALSVALLGGADDPQSDPHAAYEYGKPLDYGVNLMRRCKRAVITVDSAMNRLAHAAGIANHVLLGASVTPAQWQTHPGCHLYYGPPRQWRMEEILRLVEECA